MLPPEAGSRTQAQGQRKSLSKLGMLAFGGIRASEVYRCQSMLKHLLTPLLSQAIHLLRHFPVSKAVKSAATI